MGMHSHQKRTVFLGLLIAFLAGAKQLGVPIIETAFAASPTDGLQNLNGLATFLAFFLTGIQFIGFFAIKFVEFTLNPDFLGNAEMMGRVYSMWLISRNIMNIIFAVMLIGVAFYAIIAGSFDRFKEHVRYFVLAVILVNFSWFFPRVIVDIAHVFAATIYAIPNAVVSDECTDITGKPCVIVTDVGFAPDDDDPRWSTCQNAGDYQGSAGSTVVNDGYCECYKLDDAKILCYKLEPYSTAKGNGFAMLNGLAVNYGRITTLGVVAGSANSIPPPGVNPSQNTILNFWFLVNLAFAFLIAVVLVFPIVALGVGLLIRILILWVTMAFMPFIFLGFVINKGQPGTNVFGFEKNLWTEFLVAAFMPALVALPLCIGFIMLNVGATFQPPAGIPTFGRPLVSGIDDVWTLAWMCIAVAIMWTGAFTALEKSSFVGAVTGKIRSFGNSLLSLGAKLPLLTPIPTPSGPMTLGQGYQAIRHGEEIFNSMAFQGRSFEDALGSQIGSGSVSKAIVEKAADKIKKDANKKIEVEEYLSVIGDANSTVEQRERAWEQLKQTMGELTGDQNMSREAMLHTLEEMNRSGAGLSGTNIENSKKANMNIGTISVNQPVNNTVTVNGRAVGGLGDAASSQELMKSIFGEGQDYNRLANTEQGRAKILEALEKIKAQAAATPGNDQLKQNADQIIARISQAGATAQHMSGDSFHA